MSSRCGGGRRLIALAAAALVLGGLLSGVVAGLGATPAAAHNALRSTSPTADARPQRTPDEIVLTFDEPAIAMGTQIVVTGPSGPVQTGAPRLLDTTVSQALQPGAAAGSYLVEWRVTSADGHPVTGTFGFVSVEPGAGTPTPDSPDSSGSVAPVDPPGAPAAGSGTTVLPLVLAGVGVVVAAALGLAVAAGFRRTRAGSRSRYDRSASNAPAGADPGGDDRVQPGTDPPTETRPTPDE